MNCILEEKCICRDNCLTFILTPSEFLTQTELIKNNMVTFVTFFYAL